VGLYPRIRFFTVSPQESGEKTGDVEGLHPGLSPLGSPDMASLAFFADSDGSLPTSVHDNLVLDQTTGKPPPILYNLHLVAWKISGGSTPSSTSLATPEISTRLGGVPPQKAATKQPGSPLETSLFLQRFT
jgi:hypothetical protein